MFLSESLIKGSCTIIRDNHLTLILSAVTKVSPIMGNYSNSKLGQVCLEKSQGQVMATVDKEQWHALAFQVGK